MNLNGIKTGDIVLVDKKGRRFHAEYRGREGSEIRILPLAEGRINFFTCTAREVKAMWRKSRSRAVAS